MLKSAIRRWRERRARALEKQATARENLRNWRPLPPRHTPRYVRDRFGSRGNLR